LFLTYKAGCALSAERAAAAVEAESPIPVTLSIGFEGN